MSVWHRFTLLAQLEGVKKPDLIARAIEEYVKRHEADLKKFMTRK